VRASSDTLEHAMDVMAQHQARRLPVLGDSDQLVGMLAQADIALAARDKATGQVVEAIAEEGSSPRL
jgi:CBS domain-containing protein